VGGNTVKGLHKQSGATHTIPLMIQPLPYSTVLLWCNHAELCFPKKEMLRCVWVVKSNKGTYLPVTVLVWNCAVSLFAPPSLFLSELSAGPVEMASFAYSNSHYAARFTVQRRKFGQKRVKW
jgi:hypothetical protein